MSLQTLLALCAFFVVLQDGRIIEQGNHDELMRVNGHYAHLFSLQAKGYR